MGSGKFVQAGPGDLILWDSRVIHGGYIGPAKEADVSLQRPQLARLSFTVCQTPYALMEKGSEKSIIESRWTAFREQLCTSLIPHEHAVQHTVSNMLSNDVSSSQTEIEMTQTIENLIGNVHLLNDVSSSRRAASMPPRVLDTI
jgi:hypothetical protein